MFRPTEPRGDSLLISLCVKRRFAAVQPCCGVAKILLNVLSDKFLVHGRTYNRHNQAHARFYHNGSLR